jgi:PAS domain S-box-containing protein
MEPAGTVTREGDRRSRLSELQASLDASPLAVVNIDEQGLVTYWSSGAEQLFGWTAAEVLGGPLPTVPDDRRSEFELVHDRQRSGESFAAYRTRRLRKDGSLVDVAVWSSSRFDAAGSFLGTVAFLAPLADAALAEVLLGTHHEEFQTLVDASPLAVIAVDAEGTVTIWNAEAEAIFGWSAAEVIGGPLPHIPRQLREEYEGIRSRQVAGDVLRGVETRRRRKDGTEIEVAIWSASRLDDRGRFLGTIAFVADVTERKQAERLERVAAERAETLRRVSAALLSAASAQEVMSVLARAGAKAVQAVAGWVVLADEIAQVLRVVAAEGRAGEAHALLDSAPLTVRLPATDVLRTGQPIWLDSEADRRERYPDSGAGPGGTEASCWLPVTAGGRVLGVASFHFREAGALGDDARSLIAAIVAECERAFERSLLFEEVRSGERRLQDTNALLGAVAEGMEGALTVKDPSGVYMLANSAAAHALGLPGPEAMLGKTDDDLDPAGAETALASDRRVLESGEALVLEETFAVSGAERTFITSKSPLRDAEGEVVGVITVSTDITERKRAEERLARLHAVTAAVAQAADSLEVGSIIVESAQAAFGADGGGLALAEEGSDTVQVIAFAGVPDEVVDSWRTFSSSLDLPFNEVIRTGTPVVLGSPTEVARYPALVDRYRETGMTTGAYVPIQARGRAIGALSVTFAEPRLLDDDDLAFLTTLGREGAVALERARLYEHERDIAETLQRRLLPETLPSVRGFSLAARYVAGGQGLQVGGDWYDAVELPGGELALVVGDVVGHGIEAASTMAQLRTAVRFALLEHARPVDALSGINRLVHETHAGEVATLACALIDPVRHELVHVSAGHPPPLVIPPGKEPAYLTGGRSLPLGAVAHPQFHEEVTALEPGSTLILYTDGLVERRGESIDEGLGRLRAAAARGAEARLEDLVGTIVSSLLETGSSDDDVAVLALRSELAHAGQLTLDLPADPAVLASLRRSLGGFLHEAGAGDEDAFAITLAASEAAANAIEHAYGPADATFRLEASADAKEIRVVVRDSGRWRDPRHPGRGRGLALMEGLMDRVEFARDEGGTEVRLVRRRSPESAG